MKRILFLSLLISSTVYSQDINLNTNENKNINITTNEAFKKVTVPLTEDMSKYTHIALIYANAGPMNKQSFYKSLEKYMLLSSKTIINPYKYDRNKARKNHTFLNSIKNETWLYLYYIGYAKQVILRDYKGRTLYSASFNNVSPEEALLDVNLL